MLTPKLWKPFDPHMFLRLMACNWQPNKNNSYPLSIVSFIVSPYDKFLFGSSNIMVKTHHGCDIILMAVSACFHPIFGSWSFLHRHGELLKQRAVDENSLVTFAPCGRRVCSSSPIRHWQHLRCLAENYEKSLGDATKNWLPQEAYKHIIYQNRNIVWVMSVWFNDCFFHSNQWLLKSSLLYFSSIGCQHCRFVPRSQTYIYIYMVLLISNILLMLICFLEITHVCIIFHFSFPGFVCILFDLRRENSSWSWDLCPTETKPKNHDNYCNLVDLGSTS